MQGALGSMIQQVARGAPNTGLDVAREGPPSADAWNEPVIRDPGGAVPAEGVGVDRIGPDEERPNPNLVSPPERRVTISAEPEIILVPNPVVSEPANVSPAASVVTERSRQASVSSIDEPGAEPARASPSRSRASSTISNTSVSASEALRRQLLDDVPMSHEHQDFFHALRYPGCTQAPHCRGVVVVVRRTQPSVAHPASTPVTSIQ